MKQNSKDQTADTAEQFSNKIMNPHQRRQFEDYNIMVAKKDKIEKGKKYFNQNYTKLREFSLKRT